MLMRLNKGQRVERLQSNVAYQLLRARIIRCALPPGSAVSESMLVQRFGFGKAAIRSGLLRLCQEGLVEAKPRQGYVIAPITVRDIVDAFDMRCILEPAAARLAAGKVSEHDLRQADLLWRRSDPVVNRITAENAALKANKDFHLIIARATGNVKLVDAEARVLDDTDRLVYLGLPVARERDEVQEGHKILIEALAKGNAKAAEQAALKHVEAAKAIALDAVMSSPSFLRTEISVESELV